MGIQDTIRGRAQNTLENIALLRFDRRNGEKTVLSSGNDLPSPQLNQETSNGTIVKPESEEVTPDAHPGIQKAEAVALIWTKKVVYATYAW